MLPNKLTLLGVSFKILIFLMHGIVKNYKNSIKSKQNLLIHNWKVTKLFMKLVNPLGISDDLRERLEKLKNES